MMLDFYLESWIEGSSITEIAHLLNRWICPFFSPVGLCLGIIAWISWLLYKKRLNDSISWSYNLLAIVATEAIVIFLKMLIQRERPLIGGIEGFDSFPSSHAAMLSAFFVILTPRPFFLWAPLFFALTLIRFFDGHHHFTDILAGIFLGSITAQLFSKIHVPGVIEKD